MKLRLKTAYILVLSVFIVILISSCAPRELKPPPRTGKIIAQFSHGAPAFDVTYSVGKLDGQIKVVGTIVNTYLSDLDNFKLDINVIDSGDKVVFKDSTPVFDIEEHGSHTFVFHVPLLHGSYRFSFRYEYDYYDFAETGRRGRRFMRSDTNEWSYFENQIPLP
jgi:hypothetical protein